MIIDLSPKDLMDIYTACVQADDAASVYLLRRHIQNALERGESKSLSDSFKLWKQQQEKKIAEMQQSDIGTQMSPATCVVT